MYITYKIGKRQYLGIIYNKAGIDAEDVEEMSWELMWNEKYAGNILQFNNPRDAFATAMYYAGLDVNSEDPDVWDAALELLKEQKLDIDSLVLEIEKMYEGE